MNWACVIIVITPVPLAAAADPEDPALLATTDDPTAVVTDCATATETTAATDAVIAVPAVAPALQAGLEGVSGQGLHSTEDPLAVAVVSNDMLWCDASWQGNMAAAREHITRPRHPPQIMLSSHRKKCAHMHSNALCGQFSGQKRGVVS